MVFVRIVTEHAINVYRVAVDKYWKVIIWRPWFPWEQFYWWLLMQWLRWNVTRS